MTIEVTRRQLMRSAGGMVLGSFALPSNLRKIIENAPSSRVSTSRSAAPISEIKHVVVLMQENRSFDHYFGAMPGVRGLGDPQAIPGVFKQADSDNPDGYLYPFHTDTHSTSAQALPSNSHSWGPQHDSWNNGAMNGFVSSRIPNDVDGIAGQYSMAYFNRDDIPFQWALADAFTICDGYHCSMISPTWPNRLYLMTGQVDPAGLAGGPTFGNFVPTEGWSWQTYPELLTNACVSWKVYHVPGGRQFRLQRAGVLRPVPERADLVTAVPERHGIARIIEFPSGLGQPAGDHSGSRGRRARRRRYSYGSRRSSLSR